MGIERWKVDPAMKACFVKTSDTIVWPWRSLRYPGPKKLLDSLVFSSLDFSLMSELRGDVWVVRRKDTRLPPWGEHLPGIEKRHKGVVTFNEIPWSEYDIVISWDPIVNDAVIKAHPRILWCYEETGESPRARESISRGHPYGAYDLFLDHRLRRQKRGGLPRIVAFPNMWNAKLMRRLIDPTHKPGVFIEPRNVPPTHSRREKMRREFGVVCGLPIKYAPLPEWTLPSLRFKDILDGGRKILRTRAYLVLVGSCKYYLSWRRRLVHGQALAEAAALGLIVIAPTRSVVGPLVCHPFCQTNAGDPPEKGLRIIREIEKKPNLQAEIIRHQDRALHTMFWESPLKLLHKALGTKRA